MDNFDRKILNLIQKNADLPLQEIGEKIGLSAPSVQRRIARMKKENLIERNISVLNLENLGSYITIITQVEVTNEHFEIIENLRQKFDAIPEIKQCYSVSGEMDFVLISIVNSMKRYDEITKELFYKNEHIKRFKTFVGLETLKFNQSVTLWFSFFCIF